MDFQKYLTEISEASSTFDYQLDLCNTYFENSYNQYLLSKASAPLSVVESAEDITYEAVTEKEKESEKSFIDKAKLTMKKLEETISNVVKDFINKANEFNSSEKTKKSLETIKNAMKENPKIKTVKVKIPDVDNIAKEYGKIDSDLSKHIVKINAGKHVGKESLDQCEKDLKDVKTKQAIAVITVSLVAAIGLVELYKSKMQGASASFTNTKIKVSDSDNPETISEKMQASKIKSELTKEALAFYASAPIRILNEIFRSLGVVKEGEVRTPEPPKVKKESADVSLDTNASLIQEFTELFDKTEDEDMTLESLHKELFESADTEVSAEDYIKEMEAELFEEGDDMDEAMHNLETEAELAMIEASIS